MESNNIHRRTIYTNDLNCNVIQVRFDSDGNITDEAVWKILVLSMYKFTNFKSTPLLIALIKSIISKFYIEDDSPFIIENISEETKYYRFSNDANFSLSFTPMENKGDYLLTLSAGIEME